MGGSDQRRDPRVPLVLRVEYPGATDFVRDCTENLSASGLFIRTDRELAAGDRVPLVVSFPGLLDPVELEVEVVRRRPAGLNEAAGVAVRIPDGRDEDRAKLARLAEAALVARPSEPSTFRVLLVEDNPHVVEMYAYALKKLPASEDPIDLTIDFASNGHEALERMLRPPPVNLVIADLYMPVMDGFTLVERLRSTASVAATPVIIISGGGHEARERATELGVDVYLQKPVKFLDIVSTVRTLLRAKS